MAIRKSKKVNRPTLDEIKGQSGKYVIAMLEGAVGPVSVQAPQPRTAMDVKLKDLIIEAYIPVHVDEAWLDDPTFRRIYNKLGYIKVWRDDEMPEPPQSYTLPRQLEEALSPLVKNNAYRIATNPFESHKDHPSYKMIWAENFAAGNPRHVLEWELREMRPFLMAVKVYEERFGKRRAVLSEVDKRLKQITEKTSVEAQFAL
jgi:hypothetical protein